MNKNPPYIFDIRRGSLDDGPGIRTVVFLKGCVLACRWCHNPESVRPEREIAFHRGRCLGCGHCETVCVEGAASLRNPDRVDRSRCTLCGTCVDACPGAALRIVGRAYSVEVLLDILLKDAMFYKTSGGGVTFSGGEPLLYPEYVGRAASGLKRRGIHVAVQTAGVFNLSWVRETVLPHTDVVFFDIKLMNPDRHRVYTGMDNSRILSNFCELVRVPGLSVVPRIPLIPGITDTRENLDAIADFLKGQGCTDCRFLPYNPAGPEKAVALGARAHRM